MDEKENDCHIDIKFLDHFEGHMTIPSEEVKAIEVSPPLGNVLFFMPVNKDDKDT